MINYNDYSLVENEHLYGPGKRMLLFLQGCSIHCEGCVNKALWQFGCGKNATTEEIVNFCNKNHVEGITLHGGEPLDQAYGLYPMVKDLKESGFTVVLFTGYNKKELNKIQKKMTVRFRWPFRPFSLDVKSKNVGRNVRFHWA